MQEIYEYKFYLLARDHWSPHSQALDLGSGGCGKEKRECGEFAACSCTTEMRKDMNKFE
jgi:hypothetical protein